MDLLSVVLLSAGLAMDAFAVSVCKGLAIKQISFKKVFIIGLWFGGFQSLMPFIGYILGRGFEKYIEVIAPVIAFGLLLFIGGSMIKESFYDKKQESGSLKIKEMFILSVATSIDALAVGITFACIPVSIVSFWKRFDNTMTAVGIIGIMTLIISMLGVKLGYVFGGRYKNKAECAGGIVLIFIGVKILLEHLF